MNDLMNLILDNVIIYMYMKILMVKYIVYNDIKMIWNYFFFVYICIIFFFVNVFF